MTRLRFRSKLLFLNLLVVSIPLAGISFARFHEREVLRAMEDDMIHQAQLLRATLLADPAGPRLAQRQPLLQAATRDTKIRLRLIDERGAVVADSAALPSVDVHARREIRAALAGRYGAATRLLEDGRLYLFAALPIRADGRVTGAVYVMRSTRPAKLAMLRLRGSLFRITGVALLVTAVLSLLLAHTFERLARKLDERARYTADLAADVSHEFKSPLTSMRGAAELLLEGAGEDPAARSRFLANILADTQRLDLLVSRLLELSRADTDRSQPEPLAWDELVRETAGEETVVYTARRRRLRGRRASLAAALRNLVDNARQHAAPGTPVTITIADGRGGRLRTSVHNQGAPIRAGNLPRVWDRFFTTRAERGGTGLGLAIVRAAVEAHGGTAGVESGAAGTTFWFELPAG